MTLLIIHHINKKGEITGNSELVNVVDSAYILSKKDDKHLFLAEVKARHKEKEESAILTKISKSRFSVSFTLKTTSEYTPKVPQWYNDLTPFQKAIIDVFIEIGDTIIAFDDMCGYLTDKGYKNETSIKNTLGALEKQKIVKKYDGSKWDKIELLVPLEDEEGVEEGIEEGE